MKILLSFTFIFISFVSFGQEEEPTADQIAFDEVLEVYYDDEYDSALLLCQTFLDEYPDSKLIPRAKYNIGYILRELDRDLKAIPIFLDLLESNYDEKERFGGLMEQYALYKHRSASNLADIYLELENYKQAKKYIRLFDKKYKYQHFGGNEMMTNEIYTAKQYAKLYYGQGKIDEAIEKLLPYLFYNGLASNEDILDLLDDLLNERYTKAELKSIVTRTKSSLKVNQKDQASIEFLGTKIEVFDYQLFALGNPTMKENIQLEGQDKWEKVINTHKLLSKHLK